MTKIKHTPRLLDIFDRRGATVDIRPASDNGKIVTGTMTTMGSDHRRPFALARTR